MRRDKGAILRSLDAGQISLDEARVALEQIIEAERAARVTRATRRSPAPGGSIAVIGMSGRFPGASDIDALWRNLDSGAACVTQAPSDRGWEVLDYFDPSPQVPGKTYVCKGGFLDGIDEFAPLFFGISPREAALMDPAERLFLQEAWRAVEDAGYGPSRVDGRAWGVFAAVKGDYEAYIQQEDPTYFPGTDSFAAARLAYLLNLVGPTMDIDTACSSSLVAVSVACDSLLLGNCRAAIAGGASVYSTPSTLVTSSQSLLFSPTGRCYTFDNRANGTVLGEAVGAVVLKRVEDAQRDGDAIRGVIRGWGINQDGRTNGITAPSGTSQTRLQTSVYERFAIDPEQITLVEAHGTGTRLGDPIEVEALTRSFRGFTKRRHYCALGSIKPNIGHPFFAAGVAGLIKALLCLRSRRIPTVVNFESLNDAIDLSDSPFYIPTKSTDWDVEAGHRRCAAINSFGLTGTNAHVVVEEYAPPGRGRRAPQARDGEHPAMLVPLSAEGDERLVECARRLVEHLNATVEAPLPEPTSDRDPHAPTLAHIAFTLQVGRRELDERLAIIARSIPELERRLWAVISGESDIAGVFRGRVERRATAAASPDDIREWLRLRDLDRLGQVWAGGTLIDWRRLWDGGQPGTTHLPTHSFATQRCWFPRRGFGGRNAGDDRDARRQDTSVDVSSIELSSGKQWLCFTERWRDAPVGSPPNGSRLEADAPLAVAVASVDETDCGEIRARLEELYEPAPTAIPRPSVRWWSLRPPAAERPGGASRSDALDAWAGRDSAAPDVVLVLLPGATTADTKLSHLRLVLQCVRGLMTHWWERRIDVVVCFRADDDESPHGEAFAGLLRSATLENPNHRYRWIQHASTDTARPRDLAWEAIHGFSAAIDHRPPLVRYRDGDRRASCFEEIDRVPIAGGPCRLRPDRTYLVVGGLGEVGARLCLELARKYRCTLVILARRPADEAVERTLAQLRETGARALYFCADIAVPCAMAGVYERIKQRVGGVHGVIHLARTVEDDPVVTTSPQAFARVTAAKERGTEVIDRLTCREPLDFFLMFSSMASFGLAGSAAYAHACAFQNAFARYRNRLRERGQRQGHSLAICWAQWEVDRYVDERRREESRQRGYDLIDAHSAVRVIEACLNSRDDVLGFVAVTDKERVRGLLTATGASPEPSSSTRSRSGDSAAAAAHRQPRTAGADRRLAGLRSMLESLSHRDLLRLYTAAVARRPGREDDSDNKTA